MPSLQEELSKLRGSKSADVIDTVQENSHLLSKSLLLLTEFRILLELLTHISSLSYHTHRLVCDFLIFFHQRGLLYLMLFLDHIGKLS